MHCLEFTASAATSMADGFLPHRLQARMSAVSPQSVCWSIADRPPRLTSALTTPRLPRSVAANSGVSPAHDSHDI